MSGKATLHISEADAVRDIAALLAEMSSGTEIIIERGRVPVAVLRAPTLERRTFAEALALMPKDSPAVDEDFAKDVAEAHERFHQPLDPPAWD